MRPASAGGQGAQVTGDQGIRESLCKCRFRGPTHTPLRQYLWEGREASSRHPALKPKVLDHPGGLLLLSVQLDHRLLPRQTFVEHLLQAGCREGPWRTSRRAALLCRAGDCGDGV